MSEEEKKAIEYLKENSKEGSSFWCYEAIPNIKKVLNLLEKQQKELDKKDKIINEMANNIADNSNVYENLVNTEFQHTAEEVIDYFTKKVEGDK